MPAEPPVRRIASRQNPFVARCRALAREPAADEVLIEGLTLVAEALSAGWPIEIVAATDDALGEPAARRLLDALPSRVDRAIVSPAVMDAVSPVRSPSGIVAVAKAPARGAIQEWAEPALVVCATDIQDPGNLGAIVRVAEAAGASGAIVAGHSADPWSWKALRGSMGSTFRLPLVRRTTTVDALQRARDGGWQVIATVLDGLPFDAIDFTPPTALFVGAEGTGLPLEVIAASDVRLTVPMAPPVDSLNVAVATGIILYEARRQRSAAGARRR